MRDLGHRARQIFDAGVAAVDPYVAVTKHLRRRPDHLLLGDTVRIERAQFDRLLVVGAGKAGARMALAVEHICGDWVDDAWWSSSPIDPPACIISGGETTVTLGENAGTGGRNQELALAAALDIAGLEGVGILSGGTDGIDGPTDAAGAVAYGDTLSRARAIGLAPASALDRHDAYPVFAALGDLLVTGSTGTNVMDIHLVLIDR